MSFEDGTTMIDQIDYLFNSLELVTGQFGSESMLIDDGDIRTLVNYENFVTGSDYSYIYLKIENLKNNILIACSLASSNNCARTSLSTEGAIKRS